ncbi:hypothetical protein SB719_22010, partial [Pantoea sp. SIMBA_079]
TKLATDAEARAAFSKAMWQNLDEISFATRNALANIDASRLDAQTLSRVEAMRAELGKMESFSKIANETKSIEKLLSTIGR